MSDNTDRVYLGTKGHVLAVEASTGAEIWRTTLPFSGLAASGVVMIHPDGGHLYVGYAGHAFCLDTTTGKERRIARWEHEDVLEAVQRRLDENPQAMRQRRETVEHPFGTIKSWMGATHFLMKRLKNVRTEMALSVLAYNLTRVMNIMGIRPLLAAMRA